MIHGLVIIILALLPSLVNAKRVQILHTNDLHSFFEGTRTGKGGYARLKTKILELRAKAKNSGMKTIHLDAGDFGEGSSFFLSDEGVASLKALDMLGIDVSVIGNHDFMLGGPALAEQIKRAELKTKILSANLQFKKKLGLEKLVQDTADIIIDGMKIRVIGLTTHEIHFQYPLRPKGYISSSHNEGVRQAKRAKKDKVDYVVALTHIGLDKDINLAKKTKSIDLIVGGHSHTTLKEIQYQKNRSDKMVPILQAGAHGLNVGELTIDLLPNGESKIISYKLHPITSDIPQETEVKALVDHAYLRREDYFNRRWDEPVGISEIPLSGYIDGVSNEKASCWGEHMARMVKQNTNVDVGIHVANFEGESISPGVVTFGDIIDNFPHFRLYGDQGWQVATSKIRGLLLKKILKYLVKKPGMLGMNFYGIEMPKANSLTGPYTLDEFMVKNAKIKGNKIKDLKNYTLAYPSEVPHAIEKIIPFMTPLLFPKSNLTTTYYWPMIESYVKDNSPIRCLN
jgi:2',3'-cyclic-nucleotide 2'-phosphodiesterase (5'-nucleotidase family)